MPYRIVYLATHPIQYQAPLLRELARGAERRLKRLGYENVEIAVANGYYGYLPTLEHHRLGGYETWLGTNRLDEQASEKILAALLEMLGRLQ